MLSVAISPKQARLLSGLSQKEVADQLGVHRQTYMKWEQNADEMPVGKAKQFSAMVGRAFEDIFLMNSPL